MQISYLRFVHVAACEPMTESPSSESLQDEGNKSLYWLSVVIDGLNDGENNINFNNSILTMLLREPLTGKSNTAIVCNVRPDDDAEKTIATLEWDIEFIYWIARYLTKFLFQDLLAVRKMSERFPCAMKCTTSEQGSLELTAFGSKQLLHLSIVSVPLQLTLAN